MTPMLGTMLGSHRPSSTPTRSATLAGVPRVLRRGETLFDAGAAADSLYQVESGLLALCLPMRSGRERIVSLAGPGEFVGALAPEGDVFEERAEALSPTVSVIGVGRDAVDAELESRLFRSLDRHASSLRRRLEDADRPVATRLALTLLDLGSRYGHCGEDGATRLTLPITHEHLAAMIGAARETTSAALSTLRQLGVIRGTRGQYRFLAHELQAAAARLDPRD